LKEAQEAIMSRTTMLLTVLISACLFMTTVQAQQPAPQGSTASDASKDQTEIAAMKADLKQMRVILNQMANNLAFVSDTQSPLKHQFQLEIEMWQVLMMRMQQRIERMEGRSPSVKPAQ
jgi:hypothetical protein